MYWYFRYGEHGSAARDQMAQIAEQSKGQNISFEVPQSEMEISKAFRLTLTTKEGGTKPFKPGEWVGMYGLYCTCWWYSLCHFQYRSYYEQIGSDHLDCCMGHEHGSIFMLCLNTTTSTIKTHPFFRFDFQVPIENARQWHGGGTGRPGHLFANVLQTHHVARSRSRVGVVASLPLPRPTGHVSISVFWQQNRQTEMGHQ